MKIFLVLLFLFKALVVADADVREIRLAGSKDQVLTAEQRLLVLKVAEKYLNRSDKVFFASLEEITNPYVNRPDGFDEKDLQVEEIASVYDTASILKVIGANFARQVRGTLSKGNINYLQLQGGSLLESGSSFPAAIPQIKDQSFTVTILNVNSRGYTLKIKDTLLEILFDVSSGVTKD